MGLNDPIDHNNESSRRPADLDIAPPEEGNDEAPENRREDTYLWRNTASYAKCYRQREGHNPHDDPRHRIAAQRIPAIPPKGIDNARMKVDDLTPLHDP